MRTKALLGLAALAVGLSTSMAQVYSLNVVGYVNVSLQANKLHFLSVPLVPSAGDFNITNTMPVGDAQTDANIFAWAGTQWNTDVPQWFGGYGWFPELVISNGVGFFFSSKANSTLTFVGEVPQGNIPYNIPTGSSTLANKVPAAQPFPGGTVGHPDDNMFVWNQTGQAWDNNSWQYFADYGWFSAGPGGDNTNGPALNPTEAVFYINTAGALPFTRSFTVE